MPTNSRSALVHGDFRLDNCILDSSDPGRVAAVLDWEMWTFGDPLADLGILLFYWREPGDHTLSLVPTVTTLPGFPGRADVVESYATTAGIDVDHIDFFYAFANFKFAVITQGIAARVTSGAMGGRRFEGCRRGGRRACAQAGIAALDRRH